MECDALGGRVAPRLVVGWIDCEVAAYEQVVVVHVEYTVGSVEVAWHEDELYVFVGTVLYVEPVHLTQHFVLILIVQLVCDAWVANRCVECLFTFEALLQVDAWAFHPCGYVDECQYVALQVVVEAQAVERLDEHVDAFVLEFVASAGADDDGVIAQVGAHECICHLEHCLACLATCVVEGVSAFRHEVVFEAVGQHGIHRFVEQFAALGGCDVAHGGEAVDVGRRLFFD